VGANVLIDGAPYINFGGSSYLGLSSKKEILEAGIAALHANGSGNPIARSQGLVTGAHQAVEAEASAFFRSEDALFLGSGYYFGLAAMASLREQFHAIFFDQVSHYSLRDSIAASGLESHAFRHLDHEDLEAKLRRYLGANEKPLVVTDGLFPAMGEIAPLDRLAATVAPYEGRLLVDESSGGGASEQFSVREASVIGGSLGKAFGTCGGIIPARTEDVAAYRQAPAVVGASPGLPAAAAMCAASLRYVREHPELLPRLRMNVRHLKCGLRNLGLAVRDNEAPIATFTLGNRGTMGRLQERLQREGIFVYHVNYLGTDAAGAIRCAIFADHTPEHIERLLAALRRFL